MKFRNLTSLFQIKLLNCYCLPVLELDEESYLGGKTFFHTFFLFTFYFIINEHIIFKDFYDVTFDCECVECFEDVTKEKTSGDVAKLSLFLIFYFFNYERRYYYYFFFTVDAKNHSFVLLGATVSLKC